MLREIKENLNKCRDILCSWISRLSNVKISILSKQIYGSGVIAVKISAGFFLKNNKPILKFTWQYKGPKIGKTILQKKNKFGGLILPNFKMYYKATVIRTE